MRALTFGPYVNGLALAKLHVQGDYLGVGALDVLPTVSTAPPSTVVALDGPAVRLATADHDIELRCLITVDGVPLSPTEATARYGLRVGDRVLDPLPDVAARLTAANAAPCRHERYWVTVLEDARPLQAPQMGWHGWPTGLAGAPRRALIPLPPPVLAAVTRVVADADASAVLVAAWAAYLARLPRLRDRAIHLATVWASLPPGARSAYMLGRGRGLAGRVARACQALRHASPAPASPAAGTVAALADPLSQVEPGLMAPRPYPGRITLFVSRHTPRRGAHAADPRLRWGQLAGQGVELHWFPGDHYTMALEPAVVRLVATRLRQCLARC